MKMPFNRDLPRRGATVVIALVLLATAVTGREQVVTPDAVAPVERRAAEPPRATEAERLDLGKLMRVRGEATAADLFASQVPPPQPAPIAPAAPVVAEPPPAHVAPRLPYGYLGQMKKGDRVLIYLLKNQELVITEPGATIDRDYRVAGVTESGVHFVYLPLDTKQVLAIPASQ
jgi:hypothetical protein